MKLSGNVLMDTETPRKVWDAAMILYSSLLKPISINSIVSIMNMMRNISKTSFVIMMKGDAISLKISHHLIHVQILCMSTKGIPLLLKDGELIANGWKN